MEGYGGLGKTLHARKVDLITVKCHLIVVNYSLILYMEGMEGMEGLSFSLVGKKYLKTKEFISNKNKFQTLHNPPYPPWHVETPFNRC